MLLDDGLTEKRVITYMNSSSRPTLTTLTQATLFRTNPLIMVALIFALIGLA